MRSDLRDPDQLPYWRPDEWAWAYEPNHPGAPAYRRHACPMTKRPAATATSRGAIMLHDQGATDEQHFEMMRLLIDKYDPAFIVPGTRFIRLDVLYAASGTHNSTWRDQGIKL